MSRETSEVDGTYDAREWRTSIERANEARAADRLARMQALRSPGHSDQERIRLWESVYALRLPTDPNHSLIPVIARDTSLAVEQIRAEQKRRKEQAVGNG